jgi:tRNA threonylcarbamoyladenosine modification (KEOPS) complex  Pcc1 subunit
MRLVPRCLSSIALSPLTAAPPRSARPAAATSTARIPFPTAEEASIAAAATSVDPELRPESVSRQVVADGTALVLNFAAVDVRTLRAAVGTFLDLVALSARTLEAFPPLIEREQIHEPPEPPA